MRALDWARTVARESQLESSQLLIAYALACHSTGDETSVSRASGSSLAKWTGLGRSTVKRGVAQLRADGWLAVLPQRTAKGGKGPNLYVFTIPDSVDNMWTTHPDSVDNSVDNLGTTHTHGPQRAIPMAHSGPYPWPTAGHPKSKVEGSSKVLAARSVVEAVARGMKSP